MGQRQLVVGFAPTQDEVGLVGVDVGVVLSARTAPSGGARRTGERHQVPSLVGLVISGAAAGERAHALLVFLGCFGICLPACCCLQLVVAGTSSSHEQLVVVDETVVGMRRAKGADPPGCG